MVGVGVIRLFAVGLNDSGGTLLVDFLLNQSAKVLEALAHGREGLVHVVVVLLGGAADGAEAALGLVLEFGDLQFDTVELLLDLGVADANDLVNRERLVMGILSRGLLNVGLIINGLHALIIGLFVAFLGVLTATGCGGRQRPTQSAAACSGHHRLRFPCHEVA
ncbi:hypothetical protein PG995_002866 [Apiospora arundinis]